ncbi:MAG TPA: 30S ribosomal protein S6 [Stellaceae bacterium]|nr:30S ribosomal protein S6 [Stellaceae bacterium]
MPFYENVFIARQDVSSAQVETLTDTLANLVTEHGGKVTKREYWGLRNLSYRIKKNRKGHYILLNLDAPPAAVNELERNMRINEDVLRYLTVRVEALEEGPSAMMQARSRGEERERERSRRFDREGREGREGMPTENEGGEA